MIGNDSTQFFETKHRMVMVMAMMMMMMMTRYLMYSSILPPVIGMYMRLQYLTLTVLTLSETSQFPLSLLFFLFSFFFPRPPSPTPGRLDPTWRASAASIFRVFRPHHHFSTFHTSPQLLPSLSLPNNFVFVFLHLSLKLKQASDVLLL